LTVFVSKGLSSGGGGPFLSHEMHSRFFLHPPKIFTEAFLKEVSGLVIAKQRFGINYYMKDMPTLNRAE